jgi:hypothetical protein
MRGESALIAGVPQAVAVLDLVLAGVHAEMGEIPFDWFAASAPVKVAVPAVKENVPAVAPLMGRAEVKVSLPEVIKVTVVPVIEIPGEVWVEGEAGGVVLVMQGDRPDDRLQALAKAMMAAVGLGTTAIGWVGYTGKVEGKVLREAMMGHNGQQVLLLGQAPLGVLMGKNLGVEGWHAAGGSALPEWDGGPVGVTYPLDLLIKQPLFKRLAWQHLLAWGETKIETKITGSAA